MEEKVFDDFEKKEVDFSQCGFIDNFMIFYTYNDFCRNRKIIKTLYDRILDKNGKIFYKWYVYANLHMNETYKNAIWDYLNDFDPDGTNLVRLERFYKAK